MDVWADWREENGVAGDAYGRHHDQWHESRLIPIRQVCADCIDDSTPYVNGNDEVLRLRMSEKVSKTRTAERYLFGGEVEPIADDNG